MNPSALLSSVIVCASPGVVDGDTLAMCGERVRLWGVNAPERHEPAGPAATRALAQLIAGKTVTCTPKGSRSYGRVVALCTVRGRDVAAEMVRQGWVVDWPRYSGGYYAEDGRGVR